MNQRQPGNTSPPPETIGEAYRRAMKLINGGQLEEARQVCLGILAVRPKQPDVHNLLAAIAYQSRDSETAIAHFRQSLKLDGENPETRLNLAKTYRDFGHWADAATVFETIVKRTPNDAPVLYDLGKVYGHLGRHADTVRCYERALAIKPADNIYETDLASALMKVGNLAEADAHYASVLERTANFMPALINLAMLRDAQGRMDEALALFEEALRCDPESVDAHFHHALALIARERLLEGWTEYVWRFRRPNVTTLHDRFQMPYWTGEPLAGKTLLVWTEQGLGDEILLAGMLPDVFAQGAQCTLVCTARLAPLFQRSFPATKVLTREAMKQDPSAANGADYQASLTELGRYLRPSIDSFPRRAAYCTADPVQARDFRHRYLQGSSDRLIGIAWHSANPQAGAEKSIPLPAWEEILRIPGYRFVSLQYGDQSNALKTLRDATGLTVVVDDTVDSKTDFERFAAQVAAMDLVISVSNTTVHVAGALGIPVWTLLPSSIGRIWYWFLDRTDSPWYPSMRLFRQERTVGWGPVLHAVAQELRQWS